MNSNVVSDQLGGTVSISSFWLYVCVSLPGQRHSSKLTVFSEGKIVVGRMKKSIGSNLRM